MGANKMIARAMSKSGGRVKMIPSNDKYLFSEWEKWLSYEPEFEKQRMEYLSSKKATECSFEEQKEICRYHRNQYIARLFQLYGTSMCSEEDYMKVYDFMCKESIGEFMKSKLTSEELQYARQEITRLYQASKEQLSAIVREGQTLETYEQLSMVDAYILHGLSQIDFSRNLVDLDKTLDTQLKENEIMRQKSLYYATYPHKKK